MMTLEKKYKPGVFPKQCGCGRAFMQDAWEKLPYIGIQPGSDPDMGRRHCDDFEMRDCPCDSTIAVPLMDKGGLL